tara:strand:- start:137432 stop:137596 length:165 start_codon:yes stop_codon:yes gene_type:complete
LTLSILKKPKAHKDKIIAAAKKLVEDKKSILAYSKGEISKEELNERGVKLAMPL